MRSESSPPPSQNLPSLTIIYLTILCSFFTLISIPLSTQPTNPSLPPTTVSQQPPLHDHLLSPRNHHPKPPQPPSHQTTTTGHLQPIKNHRTTTLRPFSLFENTYGQRELPPIKNHRTTPFVPSLSSKTPPPPSTTLRPLSPRETPPSPRLPSRTTVANILRFPPPGCDFPPPSGISLSPPSFLSFVRGDEEKESGKRGEGFGFDVGGGWVNLVEEERKVRLS